jgi:hypothetical protein
MEVPIKLTSYPGEGMREHSFHNHVTMPAAPFTDTNATRMSPVRRQRPKLVERQRFLMAQANRWTITEHTESQTRYQIRDPRDFTVLFTCSMAVRFTSSLVVYPYVQRQHLQQVICKYRESNRRRHMST